MAHIEFVRIYHWYIYMVRYNKNRDVTTERLGVWVYPELARNSIVFGGRHRHKKGLRSSLLQAMLQSLLKKWRRNCLGSIDILYNLLNLAHTHQIYVLCTRRCIDTFKWKDRWNCTCNASSCDIIKPALLHSAHIAHQ